LPGAAAAQEPSLENRLVQAFQTYCIASAADPKRVSGLQVFYRNSDRGVEWTTKGLDVVIGKEPYSRVRVLFDQRPGASTRACSADVTPTGVDAPVVLAALERDLALGAGTSTVLPEIKPKPGGSPHGPRPRTDLTVWKTRMDGRPAEVELRLAEGRAPRLTLSVGMSGR
jgi:hypothetical protein